MQEMRLPALRLLRGGVPASERLIAAVQRGRSELRSVILAALREGDVDAAELGSRGRDELARIVMDLHDRTTTRRQRGKT